MLDERTKQEAAQFVSPKNKIATIFYTLAGKGDTSERGIFCLHSKDDESIVHAKQTIIGIKHRFYVKIDDRGYLFNPLNGYNEFASAKNKPGLGKDTWRFVETTESVFLKYLTFLKTRNELYLRHADKERVNG